MSTIEATTVSAACAAWFDRVVEWWRQGEARERRRRPEFRGEHADWLDVVGRDRFTRFVTEYRIAKPLQLAAPVRSIRRGRRASGWTNWTCRDGDFDAPWREDALPWTDHPEMWRDEGGGIVFTSFTYGPLDQVERDCAVAARQYGLAVDVRPDLDFYSDRSVAVIWRADG